MQRNGRHLLTLLDVNADHTDPQAARDALNLQSTQTNTVMVCGTLMLACTFALIIEGSHSLVTSG